MLVCGFQNPVTDLKKPHLNPQSSQFNETLLCEYSLMLIMA
jgi:hypothetical protein